MKDIQLRGLISRLALVCMNTIWRNAEFWKLLKLRTGGDILDVGCGRHGPITSISRYLRLKSTGIDIFKPNIKEAI